MVCSGHKTACEEPKCKVTLYLFTFWGRDAPPTMQSDGVQSDESEGLIVFTCSLCMQSDESEGFLNK